MKAIRVKYTVKPEFAETNQANIRAVVHELRSLGEVGVSYSVFVEDDGRTFMHVMVARDEAAADIIPGLAAFKAFRAALREGAEAPPISSDLEIVATSLQL